MVLREASLVRDFICLTVTQELRMNYKEGKFQTESKCEIHSSFFLYALMYLTTSVYELSVIADGGAICVAHFCPTTVLLENLKLFYPLIFFF